MEPNDISTTSLNAGLNISREALSLASSGMLAHIIDNEPLYDILSHVECSYRPA